MVRLCIPLTNEQLQSIRIKAAEVSKATGTSLSMAEIGRRFLLAWLAGDVLTKEDIETLSSFVEGSFWNDGEGFKELQKKLHKMNDWAIE